MSSDTQPHMKELLGLCSGGFSDSEDSRKNIETQDRRKEFREGAVIDTQRKELNMSELLGLCSGKFTDDENEIDNDASESREKDSENSDAEMDGHEDGSDDDEEEEREKVEEEKSEEEDESDIEEMIIKRKFGKTYEAKKR